MARKTIESQLKELEAKYLQDRVELIETDLVVSEFPAWVWGFKHSGPYFHNWQGQKYVTVTWGDKYGLYSDREVPTPDEGFLCNLYESVQPLPCNGVSHASNYFKRQPIGDPLPGDTARVIPCAPFEVREGGGHTTFEWDACVGGMRVEIGVVASLPFTNVGWTVSRDMSHWKADRTIKCGGSERIFLWNDPTLTVPALLKKLQEVGPRPDPRYYQK